MSQEPGRSESRRAGELKSRNGPDSAHGRRRQKPAGEGERFAHRTRYATTNEMIRYFYHELGRSTMALSSFIDDAARWR
jgi:hypothetical protein